MRIIILTQSDPFYLAENIDYLVNNLPKNSEIVSTVIFDVSPFGKKESFLKKAKKTLHIFGIRFFTYYSLKFVLNKFNPKKDVYKVLKKHKIPIITLDKGINHKESLEKINVLNPDLLISIAGNQIFKSELINLAPKGCLNLHTALLPKYRGLMPSFWVLKNNEKETGVSVFFVDEGIDSGPIITQKRIPITKNMTQSELITISKKIGMDAIIESIEKIESNNYQLIENSEKGKTYFSFPTRKDVSEFYKNNKKFF